MAEAGDTRNEIGGAVDSAFQAGVVHGDVYQGGIHQHRHHDRQVEWPCRVGVLPPRASYFQQRDLSATLNEAVGAGTTVFSQVLAGLGGAGKTQLAAEFARQRWADQQIDLLVWITVESREAIVAGYATAAGKIGQSLNVGQRDDDEASRHFLEWLATTDRRWLIVFDDVQNPRHLYGLWPPQQPTGHVIVTTRRQDAALTQRGHLIEVGLFTPAEATDYLHAKLADRPALGEGADDLAEALGYLPLALAQAAAYLQDRKLTCTGYLQRFTDRRALRELVPEPDSLPDDHRATLATTWSLSVELANELVPAGLARPMLEVTAVLDPNGIPDAVLTAPAVLDYLTTKLGRSRPIQAEDAREALHVLNRLSLATIDFDNVQRSVRAHALVQRATRDELSDEDLAAVAHSAANALLDIWPNIERGTDYGQILRANANALYTHAGEHLWLTGGQRVLFRAGTSRREVGLLAETTSYFQQLYEHAVEIFGPDNSDTLNTRNNLAHLRGEKGDAAGAISQFEKLLDDASRVLGPEHPNTLTTRNNIAHWRGQSGDAAGAIAELEKLLDDETRVLGPDHPSTLVTRHNLACSRGRLGDASNAVTGLEALLDDRSRVLGPNHPDTLLTRHNIALWRAESGDVTGAITQFEKLLDDRTRVRGADHPETLITRHNLAHRRGEIGDVTGAITQLEKLLDDQTRVLGPDHPDTLRIRRHLAHWQGGTGGEGPGIA